MSDRPTKLQTIGSSMFLSTIVNGLVIAFVVWIAGKAVHIDPIITELEQLNANMERLYEENSEYHKDNIRGHMHINASIHELTTQIVVLEHQADATAIRCDDHLTDPKIHLGKNHEK